MKMLLITCGLLGAFTSQAQSNPAGNTKPTLLAGPYQPYVDSAEVRARDNEYRRLHPCLYTPLGQDPVCVEGHRNGIIPIVYGFVTDDKTIQRAKRGEIKLGGCLVAYCHPRYYCPLHDKGL